MEEEGRGFFEGDGGFLCECFRFGRCDGRGRVEEEKRVWEEISGGRRKSSYVVWDIFFVVLLDF